MIGTKLQSKLGSLLEKVVYSKAITEKEIDTKLEDD